MFESWLKRVRGRRGPMVAGALLVMAALGWAVGEVGLAPQLAILLLALTLLGPPQAIRDPEVGRALFEGSCGAQWSLWFAALYAGIALAVLLGWLVLPAVTFLLVCGLVGFRLGQEAAAGHRRPEDSVVILTYGALPFVLPAAFHPDEIGTLWAWITRQPDPAELVAFTRTAAPLLAIVWCTLAGVVGGRFLRRSGAVLPLVELVAGGFLFGLVSPILALAAYAVVVQAPPRLLQLAGDLDPRGDPWRATVLLVRRGAPLIGAAVVLAGFALVLARLLGADPTQALAMVAVWGFGAFIVPHAIIQLLDRARASGEDFEADGMLERARGALDARRRRILRYRPRAER